MPTQLPAPLELAPGQRVVFAPAGTQQDGEIPTTYPQLAHDLKPGNTVLLDDGLLELEAVESRGDRAVLTVVRGGLLRSRKGINLPGVAVKAPSMTPKDETDLAFAGKSARFTASYHNVGLTPDASCTYYLARLVGLRRAQELLYTSRVLSADEAAEWGLVNASLEDRELPSQVNMIAERLAMAPTWAIGRAKNLLLAGTNDTLETHMEHESRAISEATRTQDFIEGIDAFLNKRKARFTGT